jgi:ParB/RepB/Spo0J family partition protein
MELPVSVIDFHQLRMGDDSPPDDLVSSFSRIGQLSSILVRKHPTKEGRYEVIFGNRRLAAARKLGWKTIEARIIETSDIRSLLMAFSENSDRQDFSDYEKALVIEELHYMTGMTYREIASQIGRSCAFVSQHVAILHLFSEEVATKEDRVKVLQSLTENHARILARIDDPSERWNTAKLAVAANLSVRELAKFCTARHKKRTAKEDPTTSVRRLVYEAVNGLNSKNLGIFYKPISNDFTMFSRFPPLDLMDSAAAEEHTSRLLRRQQEYGMKIKNLNVKVLGNFAYVTLVREDKFRATDRTFRIATRGTIVLAKEKDWRILHEHWSTGDPEVLDLLEAKKAA